MAQEDGNDMAKGENLGTFEQTVLAALQHLGEQAYGASIRRLIEERTERDVSIGAIYATLERLEAKGFVSSKLGEATPERGGRAKRYFKIKAPGIRAFNEAQATMARMRAGLRLQGA